MRNLCKPTDSSHQSNRNHISAMKITTPVKNPKAWAFMGVVVLIAGANYVFGWSDLLVNGQLTTHLQATMEAHPAEAALLYVALSIIGCVVLAMPGVIFALIAGTLFGAVWGTLLCWISVTLGACVSFIAGRYFLKDALKPKLAQNKQLNALFFEGVRKSDIFLLAVTRLVPVFPYNLQNFAYGITDIGFVPYAVYSALFMIPGTAVYTIAAAGLLDAENRVAYFALAAILLIATLAVARVLKRKADIQ